MNLAQMEHRNPKSVLRQVPQHGEQSPRSVTLQNGRHKLSDTQAVSDRLSQRKRSAFTRAVGDVFQFVIHLTALPQRPDDLQPAVAQRPVGAWNRVTVVKLLLELSPRPTGMTHTLACQIIDGTAQGVGAGGPKLDRLTLVTAPSDGNRTRNGLKRLSGRKTAAVITNPCQQSRRGQRTGRARKAQPPVGFRMRVKQGSNLPDQRIFVVIHHPQQRDKQFGILDMPVLNRSQWHRGLQITVYGRSCQSARDKHSDVRARIVPTLPGSTPERAAGSGNVPEMPNQSGCRFW